MRFVPKRIMADAPRTTDSEAYVQDLFSSIAPKYDFINAVLSLLRHNAWRRFAVKKARVCAGERALDVCCGTGDLALELARAVGPTGRVVGVDFAQPMLTIARRKAARLGFGQVEFLQANACSLPFADESFDCAAIAFGLRNVRSVRDVVREMARVTRPGGRVVSLEIFGLHRLPVAAPWRIYFDVLAPRTAGLFGGRREAYNYLSRSVRSFVSREQLSEQFSECGLSDVECWGLALGAVCVHVGTKK